MKEALIPLWLKIGYTLMAAVIVPAYWRAYGPVNFLWFSDIALLAMAAALWLKSRLLASMMAVGAKGCVLVGDPKYYERFGFRSLPELTHEGVPQEYVLALPFGGSQARGAVVFHESFSATE